MGVPEILDFAVHIFSEGSSSPNFTIHEKVALVLQYLRALASLANWCFLQIYIQLWTFAYIRLLNEPYENVVTLRCKNPPLKCC